MLVKLLIVEEDKNHTLPILVLSNGKTEVRFIPRVDPKLTSTIWEPKAYVICGPEKGRLLAIVVREDSSEPKITRYYELAPPEETTLETKTTDISGRTVYTIYKAFDIRFSYTSGGQ